MARIAKVLYILDDPRLLVPHEAAATELAVTEDVYKVIRPERIPFISYPY